VTERIASNEAGPKSGDEITGSSQFSSQPLLNALGRPEEEKTGTDIFLPLTNRLNGRPLSDSRCLIVVDHLR